MLVQDNKPIRILPKLVKNFPEIDFVEFDPNENLEEEGDTLNIIDTVEGIKKVVVITDIEQIERHKIYSMHDFDLGYNLKLLKKMGYLKSIRIFGVPMKISESEAIKQLSSSIRAILS